MNTKVFADYRAEHYDDYAAEAHRLSGDTYKAVEKARRETAPKDRRAAYDRAIVLVQDTVAMHQRAGNAAGAADDSESFEAHTQTWRTLNELHRQLRAERVQPPPTSLARRSRTKGESGYSTTEAMVGGLLVVGGATAAIKMDQTITVRPLGLPPSAFAFGLSVAVAVAARRYRKPRLSRAAAATAVGVAAGMVGAALQRRGGTSG